MMFLSIPAGTSVHQTHVATSPLAEGLTGGIVCLKE
jgi:hypothetical protein